MGPAGRHKASPAGIGDLLRLFAHLGVGRLREGRAFDPGRVGCRWARELADRDDGDGVRIGVAGRGIRLVTRREHSEAVLGAPPLAGGYTAGAVKRGAMSFLAPRALTIADGEAWTRLRGFNERVLNTGAAHPFAQVFLDHVRAAFERPVADAEDIRAAMGRAMTGIVLGELPDGAADPAQDVRALFGAVQSPLRRKLLAFRYRPRRERLYALLARCWEAAEPDQPTLLALARRAAPHADRAELLEQVPHWMFTFTGSGADLLARTLALITARPQVRAAALDEIAAAGSPASAGSVERLRYLEACLLETGRLFPPVTRTFHRPARPSDGRGPSADLVHWFPFLQRDDRLGATVHAFRPERWLTPVPDASAEASNTFLRGPRACPGRDLILFVCRAAIARQLGELDVVTRGAPRLARDPLPISFPKREACFTVPEALR